jgi:hypothetical protein
MFVFMGKRHAMRHDMGHAYFMAWLMDLFLGLAAADGPHRSHGIEVGLHFLKPGMKMFREGFAEVDTLLSSAFNQCSPMPDVCACYRTLEVFGFGFLGLSLKCH